jgi:membrane protease YdiL (CAAX protease family)
MARIRRQPVAIFILVTFLVSYGIGMPVQMLVVGALGPNLDPLPQLYLGRFFVVIGPTCGALAAVAATEGRIGWGQFLRDRLRLRNQAMWIAVAMPLIMLLGALAAYATIGSPLGSLRDAIAQSWPLLLAHIVLQILVIGLGEEIGWRGWLLPSLAERHGLARATVITGAIWYFWHFPVLLGGASVALWFAVAVAGISTLLSLLWLRSGGSVVPAAIAHGSVNAPFYFLATALPGADDQLAWQAMGGLLALVAVAALLLPTTKAK